MNLHNLLFNKYEVYKKYQFHYFTNNINHPCFHKLFNHLKHLHMKSLINIMIHSKHINHQFLSLNKNISYNIYYNYLQICNISHLIYIIHFLLNKLNELHHSKYQNKLIIYTNLKIHNFHHYLKLFHMLMQLYNQNIIPY